MVDDIDFDNDYQSLTVRSAVGRKTINTFTCKSPGHQGDVVGKLFHETSHHR